MHPQGHSMLCILSLVFLNLAVVSSFTVHSSRTDLNAIGKGQGNGLMLSSRGNTSYGHRCGSAHIRSTAETAAGCSCPRAVSAGRNPLLGIPGARGKGRCSGTSMWAAERDQGMNMEDDNDASNSKSTGMATSSEQTDADANAETNSGANTPNDELLSFGDLGEFDPSKKIPVKREVLVGNPQLKVKKKEKSVTAILEELAAIQQQGPRKYCILGTRHCSYLHQQIIELLSYALVLSENHVYTSGAGGTNAAAIKGALRAERPDLLTVILPQSLSKQAPESQELLEEVTDLITMPQNDAMSLDVASRLCNSKLLSETDQLIAFAFHESKTVIEATKEAKKLEMLVTMLFLD